MHATGNVNVTTTPTLRLSQSRRLVIEVAKRVDFFVVCDVHNGDCVDTTPQRMP